jgi:hypothetical protein
MALCARSEPTSMGFFSFLPFQSLYFEDIGKTKLFEKVHMAKYMAT